MRERVWTYALSRRMMLRGWVVAAVAVAGLVVAPAAWATGTGSVSGSVSNSTTLSGTTSVAASGKYAYTTAYFAGELTAIDYSNPAAPVVAGESASSNALLDSSTVNIAGGYAFVASKNRNAPCVPGPAPSCGMGANDDGTGNSLTILDIHTNPAVPAIVGTVTDATKLFGAYGVAVSGNYAYVAAQGCLSGQPCPNTGVGNSFEVIDITNTGAPAIVATLHNSSLPGVWAGTNALDHICSVAISGHYAYVTAAYSNRLTVIDISNPLNPTIVGSDLDNTDLKFPVDVAVQGNYAYVADQSAGVGELAVVDVSNPAAPKVVGSVINSSALNGAYRVRVRGNFAYVSAVTAYTVSAIDISNPPSPRLAETVPDTTHLNRTTGLDIDPTSRYVIASSPYLSSETQPLYPPFPPASGAPTMTGTISVIPLDPNPIGVSITPASEPANPTTQTSASFAFSTTDAVSSVLCGIDGAPLSVCTSATTQQYASLPAGSHTFTVQATNAAGNTATASYTWTIQGPQQPPANTSRPSISGTPHQGNQLTASNGTWTGSPPPTYAYQWSDCDASGANCSNIPGATSATYTAQGSDAGSTLEITVTASNTAGHAAATSQPTAVITAPPVNTALPEITGTPKQGDQLTASTGTWTGSPAPTFTYQWSDCDASGANCTKITGATSSTYTAQHTDVGATLGVTVTATNSGGSVSAPAAPTAPIAASTGGQPNGTSSRPVVLSVSPASGPQIGGQRVTITGTSLSGASAVMFGAVAAKHFSVSAAGTQVRVTAPAGTGTVAVEVKTPSGTSASTSHDKFTYMPVGPLAGPRSVRDAAAFCAARHLAQCRGIRITVKIYGKGRGTMRFGASRSTASVVSSSPQLSLGTVSTRSGRPETAVMVFKLAPSARAAALERQLASRHMRSIVVVFTFVGASGQRVTESLRIALTA